METAKLSPTFGLEIAGLALQDLTSVEDRSSFTDLLHRNQLVVVRDQKLSAPQLVEIVNWLGVSEPSYPADFLHPQHPEIFIISNMMENGRPIGSTSNGFGWHTDSIYAERPAAYTMLYNIKSPTKGGETLFANTCAAYEALPEEKRIILDGLRCTHSYQYNYSLRRNAPPMTEELKRKFPDVQHPLVRTHPLTKRRGLFLGKTTTVAVDGPDGAADISLIDELVTFATSHQFFYAHQARPSDFVIWDNTGLMHSATEYDLKGEERLVHRMMTLGERPI